MSANARWPRLTLGVYPELDWVETEYTPELLLEMAEAVSKNPHPIQTRTTAGTRGAWDTALESLLRALAANDNALDELNHRRPTPPARVVGLNRAVHFLGARELSANGRGQTVDAWAAVAAAWKVTPGQVKDDVAERSDDAERVLARLVAEVIARTGRDRRDVLVDLERDMFDRAAYRRPK